VSRISGVVDDYENVAVSEQFLQPADSRLFALEARTFAAWDFNYVHDVGGRITWLPAQYHLSYGSGHIPRRGEQESLSQLSGTPRPIEQELTPARLLRYSEIRSNRVRGKGESWPKVSFGMEAKWVYWAGADS
jgi:hypothetical protein